MSGFDSVLLIAFGGPEKREDVRPFLEIVSAGRRIPPERLEEVAHHYELIGGRSPLNELTMRQAEGLRQALKRDGKPTPVYVGMRNWHPFLHETLAEMRDRGRQRALGIILSSFQTEVSWERYVADVSAAREKIGAGAPEVAYAPPWAEHPLFIDAMVARAADALAEVPAPKRAEALLIFTAHSVPVAMASGSPYARQLEAAALVIAGRLGHARWQVAYQSRSGAPSDPWLKPDICDVLRSVKGQGIEDVVVVPIGFVCDHVEVLYDLDVAAGAVSVEAGVHLHRAQAANDHPAFIAMLADLVTRGPR
jgi:ferrochelatase